MELEEESANDERAKVVVPVDEEMIEVLMTTIKDQNPISYPEYKSIVEAVNLLRGSLLKTVHDGSLLKAVHDFPANDEAENKSAICAIDRVMANVLENLTDQITPEETKMDVNLSMTQVELSTKEN
jgi:hypothetical protein